MPLTFAEIAPLMRGHYVDEPTMWSALKPLTALILDRAMRLAPTADRRPFALDVLVDLARVIKRREGLSFKGPHPLDFTGWLIKNVRRVALSGLRSLRSKVRETTEDALPSTPPPEEDVPDTSEAMARQRATDIWEKLRASECPPAYRLALFAWYWPGQLVRDDLVALSQQVERGKLEQRSGLVRPVDQAWPALRSLWRYFPSGVRRSGAAQSRLAWIVRSDTIDYRAWSSDSKVLRAARETIGKWHLRGRKWLEHRATPDGGAA